MGAQDGPGLAEGDSGWGEPVRYTGRWAQRPWGRAPRCDCGPRCAGVVMNASKTVLPQVKSPSKQEHAWFQANTLIQKTINLTSTQLSVRLLFLVKLSYPLLSPEQRHRGKRFLSLALIEQPMAICAVLNLQLQLVRTDSPDNLMYNKRVAAHTPFS
eukprot:scaffold56290_cov19-Tisochrysis_lutea.AAC.1